MSTEREEGVPAADEKREAEHYTGIERTPGSEKQSFQASPGETDTPGTIATPKEEDPENHYVTGYKLVAIVVALVLASFLMLLDTSIVSTVCNIKIHHVMTPTNDAQAIPAISDEFQSLEDVGWYAAAYNLGS